MSTPGLCGALSPSQTLFLRIPCLLSSGGEHSDQYLVWAVACPNCREAPSCPAGHLQGLLGPPSRLKIGVSSQAQNYRLVKGGLE